jgi:hypothetical protein
MSLDVYSFKCKKAFNFKARLCKLRHKISPITLLLKLLDLKFGGKCSDAGLSQQLTNLSAKGKYLIGVWRV